MALRSALWADCACSLLTQRASRSSSWKRVTVLHWAAPGHLQPILLLPMLAGAVQPCVKHHATPQSLLWTSTQATRGSSRQGLWPRLLSTVRHKRMGSVTCELPPRAAGRISAAAGCLGEAPRAVPVPRRAARRRQPGVLTGA